jgi:glycosyltransferase involved in cell wall biosynthesis
VPPAISRAERAGIDDGARLHGMRILAFCDYFDSASSGGSERVAIEVYKRMAERGALIHLVTVAKRPTASAREIGGVTVHEVPLLDLTGLTHAQVAMAPALLRHVPTIARNLRPEILHANNIFFQTSLVAAILRRRIGAPLVTTAHIGTLRYLGRPLRWAAGAYEKTAGRFILSRSQRIIAVSASVRHHLVELGVAPDKVEVVANGVDLSRFQPSDSTSDATGSAPLVLFVGRLMANKGPHIMLEALSLLHDEGVAFRALFIGDGPLRPALERQSRVAGLDDRVIFAGHVDDPANLMRTAHVFVRPSLTEGMPLTVLEAMASRICVVASDIPGNRDLIQDGENGLLVGPKSASRLAQALRHVLQDADLRRRLARAGYQTALLHSWDDTADRTASVLVSSAENRG